MKTEASDEKNGKFKKIKKIQKWMACGKSINDGLIRRLSVSFLGLIC